MEIVSPMNSNVLYTRRVISGGMNGLDLLHTQPLIVLRHLQFNIHYIHHMIHMTDYFATICNVRQLFFVFLKRDDYIAMENNSRCHGMLFYLVTGMTKSESGLMVYQLNLGNRHAL